MLARKLNQKPHIGAKISSPPKSARERAVERWFLKKKPPLSTTSASGKRVPGQYYDSETGLHYNEQRYYDPLIGRYITSDPLGIKAGVNTYSYVHSNPIRYIDRHGLIVKEILIVATICGVTYKIWTWIDDVEQGFDAAAEARIECEKYYKCLENLPRCDGDTCDCSPYMKSCTEARKRAYGAAADAGRSGTDMIYNQHLPKLSSPPAR